MNKIRISILRKFNILLSIVVIKTVLQVKWIILRLSIIGREFSNFRNKAKTKKKKAI